ncbi:unnamed protein product [Timema podura]|uniref:Uncharacterized protein n=1 Tax=Timema podura TaxID=61482 RepID=A0ABN7PR81_TIMPD|nr:unnamed protein product [Timema podura]
MALLAYLGDTEMAVNIEYHDPRLTILAASTNQTRGNWDAAVLLTFSNETQLDNSKYLHVIINITNIPAHTSR